MDLCHSRRSEPERNGDVGWTERKLVAADLKTIYRAATEAEAEQALAAFERKWDQIPLRQQELAGALAGTHRLHEVSGRNP